MAKNIKRYWREVGWDMIVLSSGKKLELSGEIVPLTFNIPQEQSLFIEEFIHNTNKTWIFKPAGKS